MSREDGAAGTLSPCAARGSMRTGVARRGGRPGALGAAFADAADAATRRRIHDCAARPCRTFLPRSPQRTNTADAAPPCTAPRIGTACCSGSARRGSARVLATRRRPARRTGGCPRPSHARIPGPCRPHCRAACAPGPTPAPTLDAAPPPPGFPPAACLPPAPSALRPPLLLSSPLGPLLTHPPADTPWDRPDRQSPEYVGYLAGDVFDDAPWCEFDRDALGACHASAFSAAALIADAHAELVTGMLTPDPARRMTLREIFHHPWMMRCVVSLSQTGIRD